MLPPIQSNHESAHESAEFAATCTEMVTTARLLNDRGWTPATSSNFSALLPGHLDRLVVSRSGVDKAFFGSTDLMIVDHEGATIWPFGAKSSAETPLHLAIYELFQSTSVLHTHSVNATAVSLLFRQEICFSGLELLKGFRGITTHDTTLKVPVFPNDQDMERLSAVVKRAVRGQDIRGFLIEGHGLYTWGQSIGEARRHLEVFEFLFELKLRMEGFNGDTHHS